MRKVDDREKTKEKKRMATNVVASRPPECRTDWNTDCLCQNKFDLKNKDDLKNEYDLKISDKINLKMSKKWRQQQIRKSSRMKTNSINI